MSVDLWLKGGKVNLLSNTPATGPTPAQSYVAYPKSTGGGHGPFTCGYITLANTVTTDTLVQVFAVNSAVQCWPRLGGQANPTWLSDATGLTPLPPVAVVGSKIQVGSAGSPCKFLQGVFHFNGTLTSGVADPTAPVGFLNAFTTIKLRVEDDLGVVFMSKTDVANIAKTGQSQDTSISLPFGFSYAPARTIITFSILGSYTDGGATTMTIGPVTGGSAPSIVFDC